MAAAAANPYEWRVSGQGGSIASRTTGGPLASPVSAPARPPASGPWQPPPIPAGFYNPVRDIEGSEGRRGSEQQQTGLERQRTNSENDFASSLGVLGEQEGEASSAHEQLLARLAESFSKLKGRQEDQANSTGTLYGGALLASAMKRAGNESLQKKADEEAFQRQTAGFARQRGRLAQGEGENLGALGEALLNSRTNSQGFQQSLQTLMAHEAAQNGYIAPAAPRNPYEWRVTGRSGNIAQKTIGGPRR